MKKYRRQVQEYFLNLFFIPIWNGMM